MKQTEVQPIKNKFDNAALSPEVFRRSYTKIAQFEKECEEERERIKKSRIDSVLHPPSPLIDPKLQPPVSFKEDDAWYQSHRYHAPELEPLSKGAKALGVGTVLIFVILFLLLARFITSLPN